jgi:hypothetical protein
MSAGVMHALSHKELVDAKVKSVRRLADAHTQVAAAASTSNVTKHMKQLTKPNSPASAMKKAGVALIAAPDPFTGVAGVALVGASFAAKRKEPTSLENLAQETRKVLRDLGSLTL